jgi:hypothetical protein
MYELTMQEVDFVAGGIDKNLPMVATPSPSPSPSLDRPTPGESEWGKMVNDVAAAATAFGSWLGGKIYDLTH